MPAGVCGAGVADGAAAGDARRLRRADGSLLRQHERRVVVQRRRGCALENVVRHLPEIHALEMLIVADN